jgi:hypothetical protein
MTLSRARMAYPAHEGDGRISGVDGVALRRKIADRLGASLDRKPVQLPPHLTVLMDRLRDEPSELQPDLNS